MKIAHLPRSFAGQRPGTADRAAGATVAPHRIGRQLGHGLLGVLVLAGLMLVVGPSPAKAAAAGLPPAWTIDTVAGSGTPSIPGNGGFFGGDGGPATSALLSNPNGAGTDAAGNLYIGDTFNQRIRKVDTHGIITTVAGNGNADFTGDGGPATAAALNYPDNAVVDGAGNLYIDDSGNNRIRKVDTNGIITTVAGDGNPGFGGDGGPATSAQMNDPQQVVVDAAGNLFIADWGNYLVRKVDTRGIITTVAGDGTLNGGYGGDGGPATSAQFQPITGVAVDNSGNLYIADAFNNRIRKVDTGGIVTTVAGNGTAGYSGDRGPATAAQLSGPSAVAVQGSGNLFISDLQNSVVRRVDAGGTIDTVAGTGFYGFGGDGGYSRYAQLTVPVYLAVDPAGNLLIPDQTNNRIRRVRTSYLWISTSPDPAKVGDKLTYDLSVAGLPTTTTGVTLTATLAPEVAFATVTSDQGSCARTGMTVTCQLGTIQPATATRVHIAVTALKAGVIPITGTIASASPAIGAYPTATTYHKVSAAGCGRKITTSTTLTADLGPCAGNGLIVSADNLTVSLGHHRIFGFPGPGNGDEAGIRVPGRHGVTLVDGTVSDFDAGVVLSGGGGHLVANLTIRDNVGPDDIHKADLGDGILVDGSAGNRIIHNVLSRNGIFDGIGVLGPLSNDNTILQNTITGTVGPFGSGPAGQGIIVNAAENNNGDFLTNTKVLDNTIDHNASAGIANINSVNSEIARNTVTANGTTNTGGNGIGMQVGHHPKVGDTNASIHDNQVHGNAASGIVVKSGNNHITSNQAANNDTSGFPWYNDLQDTTTNAVTGQNDCTTNVWSANTSGSGGYTPACTIASGTHGATPAQPASAAALAPAARSSSPAATAKDDMSLTRPARAPSGS